MHIENKFLRFLTSIFITLGLFYLIVYVGEGTGDKQFVNILGSMIIAAIFGIFLVVPSLSLFTYTSYHFLTLKENRSKNAPRIFKVLLIITGITALLYFLAFTTDLLDN